MKIFDTTLRDGEQTDHVAFSPSEKLIIAKNLLTKLCVDEIEIGSCRVSDKEKDAIMKIANWAKDTDFLDKISVLSFADGNKSIDWLLETECRNINILSKGSRKHCELQLKKTLSEHIADIENTINYAKKNSISTKVYLEDWSNGITDDENYVYKLCDFLVKSEVKAIILCDTLGILNPWKTEEYCKKMLDNFPNTKFEFHCHNDYGLATINSIFAVKSGISCIHGTINGLGERAGNTNLIEFCVAIKDHCGIYSNISESNLSQISSLVERFSGKRVANNFPIVGRDVFTQTAGIHADGDKKGDLYISKINPKRFNRDTNYSLGKMSGKSSLDINLEKLGINITDWQKKMVLEKIVSMGDKKESITLHDLPFLIADVIGEEKKKNFEILECIITSSTNLLPMANIKIRYFDKEYCDSSTGNGGYDAFMNAIKKISTTINLFIPELLDFEVHIPQGGKTNALVETIIYWQDNIRTVGVSSDQIMASIKATERVINIFTEKK